MTTLRPHFIHSTYRLIISILYETIHILSHTHATTTTTTMNYSAKSTDDFNDFMSYLGGAPLPPPRKVASYSAAPSRPAPARQSNTVAKPAPVARRGSSNGSNKSSTSKVDEISAAHLHFNPKLRNSIRA